MVNKIKIIRTWKGWTTTENAPIYREMLINEVFPAVKKKSLQRNPEAILFLSTYLIFIYI